MNEKEIKKLVWNWEMFVSNKEKTSINEEVISEYIDEFLNYTTKKMSKKEFYFLMGFFTAGTLAIIAFGLATIF